MDEIARRNGASQPQSQQATTAQAANNTANNATSNTTSQQAAQAASNTEPRKHHTYFYNEPSRKDDRDYNFVVHEFMYHTKSFDGFSMPYPFTKWDKNTLISILEKLNVAYQWHGNEVFILDDVKRQIIAEYQKTTTAIEPQAAAPQQQKQIGFSDNRTAKNTAQTAVTAAKSPNEGRVIIKGFQRQNAEKTDNLTAVTTAVTAEKKGTCKRCENEFEKTVYNKKFCCEDCKILYWQEKNGKILRKGTAIKV